MDEKTQDATMSPGEAHAIIGRKQLSRASFYQGLKRNEIPNIRIGHRILIPRYAFQEWLANAGIQPRTVA